METNNQSGFFGMWATGSKGCVVAQGRDPYRHQISTCPHHSFGFRCGLLCLGARTVFPSHIFAGALDQLPDPTDKAAQEVVTLKDATTSTASTCTM